MTAVLRERIVGEYITAQEDQRMTDQVSIAGADDQFIAKRVRQLYESGDLARQIMTIEEVANKYGVPFPTVNSWTRGNPQTAKNYLPVLQGITKKERLVLVSDFLKCYFNWTPRKSGGEAAQEVVPEPEPEPEATVEPPAKPKRARAKRAVQAAA